MKASRRPQMMRLFDGIQTVMILMALQNVMTANDRILVHDTFADNNMFDGTPAMWGAADCGGSCDGILTRFDVTDGQVNIGLNESFAMWRILSVDGEALEAANDWSVRAHFRSDIDITSIFGVGTDSLYWAARPFHAGDQTTHLANGHGWDNNDSEDRLPSFDDWVVQLDMYPDHLDGFAWSADTPEDRIQLEWDRGFDITPGLPVIWGNWGGGASFDQVILAKEPLPLGGDYNKDGILNPFDVDRLADAIRAGENDAWYNISNDEDVNLVDLDVWVHQLKKTTYGDANLDTVFDSTDLILVFQGGKYEVAGVTDATWISGDWNADGRFDSRDMIAAFQDGGYQADSRIQAVPEPTVMALLPIFALTIFRYRKRKKEAM